MKITSVLMGCAMAVLSGCNLSSPTGQGDERIIQESFSPRYNSYIRFQIDATGYEWKQGKGFLVFFVVVNTSNYNWYGYPELIVHPEFTEPMGENILSIGKGVITTEVIQERMIPTDELEFIPAGGSRECLVWASFPEPTGQTTGYYWTSWGFVITTAKRAL